MLACSSVQRSNISFASLESFGGTGPSATGNGFESFLAESSDDQFHVENDRCRVNVRWILQFFLLAAMYREYWSLL